MDFYYLPEINSDGEVEHNIYAPHFKEDVQHLIDLGKGHHEELLCTIYDMGKHNEELELHYASNLNKDEVATDSFNALKDEAAFHFKWAAYDVMGALATTATLIGSPVGGYIGYRAFKHVKAYQGAKYARDNTKLVKEDALAQIEDIMSNTAFKSRKEAYQSAVLVAMDNDMPDVAAYFVYLK